MDSHAYVGPCVITIPQLNTYINENNVEVVQTTPYIGGCGTNMVIFLIKTFDNGGMSVSQFDTYSTNFCNVDNVQFQRVQNVSDFDIHWQSTVNVWDKIYDSENSFVDCENLSINVKNLIVNYNFLIPKPRDYFLNFIFYTTFFIQNLQSIFYNIFIIVR